LTDFEVRPATSHQRMRWANGGGWTTEIIAEPSSARWTWRLSVADIEVDGPFSAFPGVDRSIALLRGAGFGLTVGASGERLIDTPFRPFDFAGDETTSCRLIDGPVQDLNLMSVRAGARHRLEFVHLAPDQTIELVDVDVVVVVSGPVRVGGHRLGYLDTIRCAAGSGSVTLRSVGDEAVVASVTAPIR
jgi:environmental stress-induced protein Ves